MKELVKEVLSLAESNATWIESAAEHFEQLAAKFHAEEKAKWELLAVVYRERAQSIQGEAEKVRASLGSDSPSESGLENT
jgi:hypothetical protein